MKAFTDVSDNDLRLIHLFLAIVDAQGLTAAEITLGLRQSTISSQLALLESRVGFRLCERGRGGFRLTDKGVRFVALARDLLTTTQEFATQVGAIDNTLIGTLALGINDQHPIAQNQRLAACLRQFRQRHRAVRVAMSCASATELETQLIQGRLDLAVSYFWRHVPTLRYVELFTEQQSLYCGQGHPLFHTPVIADLRELGHHDWVLRSYPVPEDRMAWVHPQGASTTDNIEAAIILILSGTHIGYLPTHSAAPMVAAGLLQPLAHPMLVFDVPFSLAMREDTRDRTIACAFCEDLWQEFGLATPLPGDRQALT